MLGNNLGNLRFRTLERDQHREDALKWADICPADLKNARLGSFTAWYCVVSMQNGNTAKH
jgi:hypothetical protein